MSDDGSAQSNAVWPLPKFSFTVEVAGQTVAFQEVSGMDVETQVIEYRAGNSPVFNTVKMPGLKKYGNVTMKKGVFKNGGSFWDWCNHIKMNTIKQETVTISLIDETGKPTMVWTLHNAWPIKITSTDLKSTGNEVAVETIEFAHEGISIANG